MELSIVFPMFWGRKKKRVVKEGDYFYDHPTALDDEGTIPPLFESMKKVDGSGNVTIGNLVVVDWRTSVSVELTSGSETAVVLPVLVEMGFVAALDQPEPGRIIGTVDIRKLAAIAALKAVKSVEPVVDGKRGWMVPPS